MRNFADDIELQAGDDEVQQVVIGEVGWGGDGGEKHARASTRKGRVLPWSEARELLDYDYEVGFAMPDCHAVYAWTEARVVFVSLFHGLTRLEAIPRSPIDCMPEMPGG